MEKLLEIVLEKKLEISKTYKIKQDQRNLLKAEIETALIELFNSVGIECKEVDKALGLKLDNLETKTPKGYIPIKITVAVPSIDFDIDLENKWLIQDRQKKIAEKEKKATEKANKIERDKKLRASQKAEKLKALETAE